MFFLQLLFMVFEIFNLLEKIISPEWLIATFIVGYFFYLIIFHNTKEKKSLRETDVFFIVLVLGFLLVGTATMLRWPLDSVYYYYNGIIIPENMFLLGLIVLIGIGLLWALSKPDYFKIKEVKKRLNYWDWEVFYLLYFIMLIFNIILNMFGIFYSPLSSISSAFLNMSLFFPLPFLFIITFIINKLLKIRLNKGVKNKKQTYKKYHFFLFFIILIIIFSFISLFFHPQITSREQHLYKIHVICENRYCNSISYYEFFEESFRVEKPSFYSPNWMHIPFNENEVHIITNNKVIYNEEADVLKMSFDNATVLEFNVTYSRKGALFDTENILKLNKEKYNISFTTTEEQNKIAVVSDFHNKQGKGMAVLITHELPQICELIQPQNVDYDIEGKMNLYRHHFDVEGRQSLILEEILIC